MQCINVYSSAPLTTQLAVAFQGLKVAGLEVALRPLSELPLSRGRRLASLQLELLQVCQRLVLIGQALEAHEAGRRRLEAGSENGLRSERDGLRSRKRALEATLRQLEGGQQC